MPERMRPLLLVSMVLLIATSPSAQTSAATTLAVLTPVYQSIGVGQVATVTLWINQVDDLYRYQAAIVFDPAVLEVIDADVIQPGIQTELGTFLESDYVQQNKADNSVGGLICVVSQLPPSPAVSGSGALFTIAFKGKARGLSAVRFSDLRLERLDGAEIEAMRYDAQISVGGAAPPTAMPSPAQTPTIVPTALLVTPIPTLEAAAAIAPTPNPESKAEPVPNQSTVYIVRTGDTLSSISQRFGTSAQVIVRANRLTNPNYIQIGQQLVLPTGSTASPSTYPGGIKYIVQTGETLYGLAYQYGTTVRALALMNGIANPSRIYAGQRLIVPGGAASPFASLHLVRSGETLYSIAHRYGSTVWTIALANALHNPNVIYADQYLVIP
jgi:LysM repeat protein